VGQEKVVKDILDKGFDKEEQFKKALSPVLVPTSVTGVSLVDNTSVIPKSIRIVMDEDVVGVTMERAYLTSTLVKIKPITHDEYLANLDNPFKKPDSNYGFWRFDELSGSNKVHIIITDLTTIGDLTDYRYVAVGKPTPIIIEDSTYSASDGSIDGVDFSDYTATELPSTLGTFIHRWIVQEAVNIAFASDKDQLGYQISNAENIENIKNK